VPLEAFGRGLGVGHTLAGEEVVLKLEFSISDGALVEKLLRWVPEELACVLIYLADLTFHVVFKLQGLLHTFH